MNKYPTPQEALKYAEDTAKHTVIGRATRLVLDQDKNVLGWVILSRINHMYTAYISKVNDSRMGYESEEAAINAIKRGYHD